MAPQRQITFIHKANHHSPYKRIQSVGGKDAHGKRWRMTVAEVIRAIKQRRYSFFVERPRGHPAGVTVSVSARGHQYIKTVPDSEHPNNLLSQPDVP